MHERAGRLVALLAFLCGTAASALAAPPIAAPVLKWQRGGCTGSSCQRGWYASPAVVDLDGDGRPEVVSASYDLVSLDGASGTVEWRQTHPQRVWPGVVVADLTGDGTLEVVVGRGSDTVRVHDRTGALLWSANPFGGGEVRTLAVEDLENDGQLEVVVGRASGGSTRQLSAYSASGALRPGWPARRDNEAGFGWGMYNENVTIADLDGDGLKEIIGPTDTHYITALDRNGNQLQASSVYGNKVWSQVGVHVDHAADLRGFANCGTEHRPNFANSAPAIADLDGDGVREIVVVGDVYNCGIGDPAGDLYHMPFILRRDRTRWAASGFDWTVLPAPRAGSAPLTQDFNVIENSVQNTVLADLDGDGRKEILFPSYDGRLHVYWLDKTQKGNWPYDIPGSGIRFASEPVVADLNADGKAEVIFTSWPEKVTGRVGQLHILDYLGNVLHAVDLPAASGTWNGSLAAPTLADIDGDADLEAVVATTGTGVVAYDLPGTAWAEVRWATGRGGNKRTGFVETPALVDNRSFGEGDFNGDGRGDLLWRHAGGALFVWLMQGTGLSGTYLQPLSLDWQVQAVGDLNGDGRGDILWREKTTGFAYVWIMNGPAVAGGSGYTSSQADQSWQIEALADLDGDARSDIVWRHTSGALFLWLMDGTSIRGATYLDPIGFDWRIAFSGDFNGDGRDDILWRQKGTGRTYIWIMNGPAVAAGTGYTASEADETWQIAATGDLNGDSRSDIVWRHSGGALFVWLMNGTSLAGTYLPPISTDWEVQGSTDVNGDNKDDILWRQKGTGATYVWLMDGPTTIGGTGYTASQADPTWRVKAPR